MFVRSGAAGILQGVERPLCECHGEPMQGNGSKDGKPTFTCGARRRLRDRLRDPIRNKQPRRRLQQRVSSRNRATEADLKLIRELKHQLLTGGTE